MSELGQGRERPTNYINICKTLVNGYPNGLAHGLQKDAIQNSLDARAGEEPAIVEFEILKNDKGRFLTITDKNTWGLRGKHNEDDITENDEDDIAANDEFADWIRFESFAFTKPDPKAIGARGQGKFVMLRSSNEYKMFYDTRREDGVYRLGATQAREKGCPIWPGTGVWEGDTAVSELAKHCGLQPLQENGTRLIIFDPKEEVLEAIKNGDFRRAIQETWFRAIKKKQLEVWTIYHKLRTCIDDPKIAIDTNTPSAESWILNKDSNNNTIRVSTRNRYKVKQFKAYYDPDRRLDEAWQGIAIIHNNMKICSIPGGNQLPPFIKEKITGFIEFDEVLDQELRKGHNQNPNHYELTWNSPIPRAIRTYINKQLDDFGKKKLGLLEEKKEKKKQAQTEAEDWAMEQLQKHAPDLRLLGARGRGNSNSTSTDISSSPKKDIGIIFKDFTFPDKTRRRRVNFKEEISFNLAVFNETSNKIKGEVSLQILKGDKVIKELFNESIEIEPKTRDCLIKDDDFVLIIDELKFNEKGEYKVQAKLSDETTGDKLHTSSKSFWVEEDPPQRNAPFELIPTPSEEKFAWKTNGTLGDEPKLFYNTNHPEYREAEDENSQSKYMLKICLEGAIHFILSLPEDDNVDDLYAPLDTHIIKNAIKEGDPARIHEEAMQYIAQIRWKIYQSEGG